MAETSYWWSVAYIEERLAKGGHVPKHRLIQYYADKAGLLRPDACMHCGHAEFLFLTRKDLNLPDGPDNLVYLCGSCRGRALKEHNRKPPGRPKLSEDEKQKRAAAKSEDAWKIEYQKNLSKLYAGCRIRTMDDPLFE